MKGSTSPLLGFNNNVRYRGRVFHIQTEDSGVRHPHVITHLFMDGGRILKTQKTSYAEHVDADNGQDTVKQLMRSQHEAMFKALRAGEYDAIIQGKIAAEGPKSIGTPSIPEPPPPRAPIASMIDMSDAPLVPIVPIIGAAPPSTEVVLPPEPPPAPPPSPVAVAPKTEAQRRTDPTAATAPAQPAIRLEDIPKVVIPRAKSKPPQTPPAPNVEIDVGHIERAANAGHTPAPRPKSDHNMPPPVGLTASKPDGGYRELSTERQRDSEPAARSLKPAPRPAAQSRPAKESRSIFGDDMISEKSLDEVILSYLAEDLDGSAPPKK